MEIIVISLMVISLYLVYTLRCMSEKEQKLLEDLHTCRYQLMILSSNKQDLEQTNEKYHAIIIEQDKELQKLGAKKILPSTISQSRLDICSRTEEYKN